MAQLSSTLGIVGSRSRSRQDFCNVSPSTAIQTVKPYNLPLVQARKSHLCSSDI